MNIADENPDMQVRRLMLILSPDRSRIRTYLGVYGIRSHVLLRNGCPENNCPTISWYTEQLGRAGVSRNYWNIRRHLKRLASLGVFRETRATRLVDNSLPGSRRLTSVGVCEFHISEKLFPSMHEALKKMFRTDSLSSIYS